MMMIVMMLAMVMIENDDNEFGFRSLVKYHVLTMSLNQGANRLQRPTFRRREWKTDQRTFGSRSCHINISIITNISLFSAL